MANTFQFIALLISPLFCHFVWFFFQDQRVPLEVGKSAQNWFIILIARYSHDIILIIEKSFSVRVSNEIKVKFYMNSI